MTQQQSWNNDGADDLQMPLGTGGDVAPADDYVPSSAPRINTSTMALVAAFAAALIVLYLLGFYNKPRAVSAAESAQEALRDRAFEEWVQKNEESLRNVGLSETQRIMELLTRFWTDTVSIAALPCNPFEKETVAAPIDPNIAGPRPVVAVNQAERERQLKLRELAEEFDSLRVQLIMLGNPPAALISNGRETKMVTVGSRIGQLAVTAIKSGSVVLGYEDYGQWELKPNAPQMNAPRPR